MRKFLFSILFLGLALYAQAGPWYSGANQMANLIEAVVNVDTGDAFIKETMRNDKGRGNTGAPWWKVPGFVYRASGEPGEPSSDGGHADRVLLEYREPQDGGSDKYWAIRSIDWSNKGYEQRKGSVGDIQLVQWPNPETTSSAEDAEDNELRWLEYVNFSGNRFRSIEINGQGVLSKLKSVNLSNNPTLEYFDVVGCTHPDLKVDISNNGFSFDKIFSLIDDAGGTFFNPDYTISSKLVYGPQGTIIRAFAPNRVDLSLETGFGMNDYASTYTFTEENGTPVTPTVVSKGVFSFPASYNNKKVRCNVKNAYFTQIPQGIDFLITLTDDVEMMKNIDLSPKNMVAYQNEAIAFKVQAFNYLNNPATDVTVKWESANGTFDNDASFTPKFTPAIEGNVKLKCTATQRRAGKEDIVLSEEIEFFVNEAHVIFYLEVEFHHNVYLLGEEAPFTIKTESQHCERIGSTAGVNITADKGEFDLEKKSYTCFQKGMSTLTFDAGNGVKKIIDLVIVYDDPIDAAFATASSTRTDGDTDHSEYQMIDGSRSTRWAGKQYTADDLHGQLGSTNKDLYPEWVVVDLGEVHPVCMIEVDWEVANATHWKLSVSADSVNWDEWYEFIGEPKETYKDHFIGRVYGESQVRYIKVDCLERGRGYLGGYSWNFSIWEIVAYAGDLTPIKKTPYQSDAYYKGGQLLITGEGSFVTDIYTVTGQKVLTGAGAAIDVSSLSQGCYIAKIVNENGAVSTVKFVK